MAGGWSVVWSVVGLLAGAPGVSFWAPSGRPESWPGECRLIMPNQKFSDSSAKHCGFDANRENRGSVLGVSGAGAFGKPGRGGRWSVRAGRRRAPGGGSLRRRAGVNLGAAVPGVGRSCGRSSGRSLAVASGQRGKIANYFWGWIMPLPALVLGGVSLAARLTPIFRSKWAWMSAGALAAKTVDIYDEVKKWAVVEVAERAGLQLDPDNPFSDASFCNALYQKTGVQFRTLLDRASVEQDLESYAIEQIQMRTGFQMTVTSFRDVEGLKLDLVNIGLYTVQQRTGIPVAQVSGTPGEWGPQIKEQLLTYAEAELRQKLAGDAQNIAAKMGELVDLDALAGQINQRLSDIGSTQDIDVRGLALSIAQQVSAGAVNRFQVQAAKMNKQDRRAVQNREAQRRFREKWGDRRQYVPLSTSGGP